jgi:tRNA (guanine37-N1)-methyltransferase
MKKIPQDIVGDIAILKFPRRSLWITKKIRAMFFLRRHKGITTVLEKVEGFSGELRMHKTRHLAGMKTKEATYKENECVFKFNVDKTYFSPRLSNERKIISDEVVRLVKKKTSILVMFAGISPYPIVIAKKLKQKKVNARVYANELNEDANRYAEKNVVLNKLKDYVVLLEGDAKKLPQIISKKKAPKKFDIILMPRPNIDETFLDVALKLSKKGTIIFYHGFGTKEEVLNEISNAGKSKIGKICIRKAGDIGPHRWRWQAFFRVK